MGPGGRLGDPSAGGAVRQFGADLPDGWLGADIGPGTAAAFADMIADAGTVFWNGPLGAFEDPRFAAGTFTVAEALAETRAHTVVGGGDSGAALTSMNLAHSVSHLSTGGGASLQLLEHGDLPGLATLRESAERLELPTHEVEERD
ncbi:MAG: phosphoglycerate kinase, partial [bacterium]|nr:phosphoglycerate kinase [bacterium]